MKSIAIYCGSALGSNEIYTQAALQVAQNLLANQQTLVFGGAKVGIMGVLANEMLKHGGKAIGVMPQSLVDIEVAHEDLTQLHIVASMHERKALIENISDGFIILPGGIGTMDEFFEIFTWSKLGFHNKPIAILNINGYYDHLLNFMEQMVAQKFLAPHYWQRIIIAESAHDLFAKLDFVDTRSASSALLSY